MLTATRISPTVQRLPLREELPRLERAVDHARKRVCCESPFSPSWDAAMAGLEDAEHDLWRAQELTGSF